MEVWIHSFLTLTLDGVQWLARSERLVPRAGLLTPDCLARKVDTACNPILRRKNKDIFTCEPPTYF